jgi:nitroreductase/ketosteroid isomerase-like protein
VKTKYLFIGMSFWILITNCLTEVVTGQELSSIREVFDRYVQAIHNSDIETLFTTVTEKNDFFFLTSTGELIDTREGYYKFHTDWFKESEWEMPVELLNIYEGDQYGYSTAIFHYRSKVADGRTYNLDSYFTLIFNKEKGHWKVVADVCTPISRYYTEDNPEVKYDSEQEFAFNIIKNRRTVRKYKSTPVPEEHVIKILDAARMAPTAGNQQPWKFMVIRDRGKLDELKEIAPEWYITANSEKIKPEEIQRIKESIKTIVENALSAPVYIAVLVDSNAKYSDYIIYDGSLAAGYLMIAARVLGYGTGFFTTFFPEKQMKEFFNIPDNYKLICFTPIGIPEEWPECPQKKDLKKIILFESF